MSKHHASRESVCHGRAGRAEPPVPPGAADAAEARAPTAPRARSAAIALAGAALTAGLSLALAPPPDAPAPDARAIDFSRDIRPILSNNCYLCHGPDPSSRKADLRLDTPAGLHATLDNGGTPVTPGDRDASELWRRITAADPDDHMPPPDSGKHLTPEQIDLLGRWIDAGAPWKDHWSFEPILRHPLPDVQDEAWCRSDLDRFVLARIESEGLTPSPRADKHTLIRRVTLDLTGLPPTPEETDAFLADNAPDAYERLVDRLLASARYGERWARVWLDLARYADTKGYEKDAGRTIWPYRDWVIRALNDDMPFDQFTIKQLAGDLLPNPTDDDILATAFHRNTMNNDEGGTDDEEFRTAAVKDRLTTTFSVWNGLTMTCAECHTHKYDPITQTEYYQALAFFNQTADADRPDEEPTHPFGAAEQQARLAEIESEISDLKSQIDTIVNDNIKQATAALPPLPPPAGEGWGEGSVSTPSPTLDHAHSAELPDTRQQSTAFLPLPPPAGEGRGEGSVSTPSPLLKQPDGAEVPHTGEQSTASPPLPPPAGEGGGEGSTPPPSPPLDHQERPEVPSTTAQPSPSPAQPTDWYWIDDSTPPGVTLMADSAPAPWRWYESDEHAPAAGLRSLARSAPAFTQQYFDAAPIPLTLREGDKLITSVWLDEADPPREIMLQIHTTDGSWEHRAYWGENLIGFGADNTGARRPMGQLPDKGRWVRLELDPADLNLAPGAEVDGWALSQHAGTARWDAIGLATATPPDERWAWEFSAWRDLVAARGGAGLPEHIRTLLRTDPRTPDQQLELERYYRRTFHRPTRDRISGLTDQLDTLRAQRDAITARMPRVPVMAELPAEQHRTTHLLSGGSFLAPQEQVSPAVPEALHPFPDTLPRDRLGLAQWLAAPDNPLAPRVTVNRFWERFFGRGLVETMEDFGAQGTPPTHPELLDHLALTLIDNGWSLKQLCRYIVTSSTYQQTSDTTPELLERDLYNTLYARGPRFRLEAETLRDQALAVSNLLSPRMFGPPVYPPQPDGIWQIVYSGESWMTSTGENRYRRSLYTYWRRTSPYPSMTTFDAPSREVCTPRRINTNTPLQALVTLNDPVYIEAAQALARRMIHEGGPIASDRASRGLTLALARQPRPEEIDAILSLVADEYQTYRDNPADALAIATNPLGPLPDNLDPAEAAAWTIAANVILNLDEFLTRK
ncbi:MAG: DUF1553 domain-containing protein [Phycisphaerales bacterium]|nr:DUF1553 domain-containing protein [Phycisphaerales bacterium]